MTITGTSALGGTVKAAYDRYVEFALRSVPTFRTVVDKKPVAQAMPGSSVVFSIHAEMADKVTTLTEGTDPTAVAVADVSQVTVTLNEYGNVVTQSRKLGELSFADVDPQIANLVAYNMSSSLDVIVATILDGGTNVIYATGGASTATSTVTTAPDDVITGTDIRKAVAKLRAANAAPKFGNLYAGYIHPEVAHDLRSETGAQSFEDVQKYTNSSEILAQATGVYGGCYFMETARALVLGDGASSINVYRTNILGAQAVAEATAVEPGVVVGPVTDQLMRQRPIGWYSLQGWSMYRQAAAYRIESSSSIA
jgi:N4-gp56 family major capsid protein